MSQYGDRRLTLYLPWAVDGKRSCGKPSTPFTPLPGLAVEPELLSCEGPFGVGYGVAVFAVTGRDENCCFAARCEEADRERLTRRKAAEISTHASGGDAMVTVLEGTGKFTVGGEVFILHEGETLIMPKDIPHAVYGQENFNIQLTVTI